VELDDAGVISAGASDLSAATSPSGTTVVAWKTGASPNSMVWAAVSYPDGGEQTSLLSNMSSLAYDTSTAINSSDHAVVSWVEGSSTMNVWAAELVAGTWTTPVQLNDAGAGDVSWGSTSPPMAVIDGNGVASVTWLLPSSTGAVMMSSHLDGGWTEPTWVKQGTAVTQPTMPVMATNSAGQGIVVWNMGGAMASKWDPAFDFGAPAVLSSSSVSGLFPIVTPAGQSFVMYTASYPLQAYVVHCP
jgi:hypothetical protein